MSFQDLSCSIFSQVLWSWLHRFYLPRDAMLSLYMLFYCSFFCVSPSVRHKWEFY